jgi:hypothetical protein
VSQSCGENYQHGRGLSAPKPLHAGPLARNALTPASLLLATGFLKCPDTGHLRKCVQLLLASPGPQEHPLPLRKSPDVLLAAVGQDNGRAKSKWMTACTGKSRQGLESDLVVTLPPYGPGQADSRFYAQQLIYEMEREQHPLLGHGTARYVAPWVTSAGQGALTPE